MQLLKLIPTTLLGQSATETYHPELDDKSWTELVYESANPDLQQLVARAKTRMPPRLVSTLFQLSNSLLSRRLTNSDILKVTEMTGILIDADCPSLRNVQGRAWLGSIIKSLPTVSL